MNPDHCYTTYAAVNTPTPPAAVWTFHHEGDARATAVSLRAQGTKCKVMSRHVSVCGVALPVWCVVLA